ncbi:hypothetical protein C8R43DRAFT_965660 [Mycena crocata]|nr:hypothetical protein C8R43DRAFT_965660 [Mycena crocata]
MDVATVEYGADCRSFHGSCREKICRKGGKSITLAAKIAPHYTRFSHETKPTEGTCKFDGGSDPGEMNLKAGSDSYELHLYGLRPRRTSALRRVWLVPASTYPCARDTPSLASKLNGLFNAVRCGRERRVAQSKTQCGAAPGRHRALVSGAMGYRWEWWATAGSGEVRHAGAAAYANRSAESHDGMCMQLLTFMAEVTPPVGRLESRKLELSIVISRISTRRIENSMHSQQRAISVVHQVAPRRFRQRRFVAVYLRNGP